MIPYAEVARKFQEIHLQVTQIAGHLLTGIAQEEEEEIAGSSGAAEDEAKIASTDGRTEDGPL